MVQKKLFKIQTVDIQKKRFKKRRELKLKNSVHNSLKIPLLTCQLFGIMPLEGITMDVYSLKFKYFSVRTITATLSIFGAVFITILQMYKCCILGWNLEEIRLSFFFISTMLSSIYFLGLATRWPKVMRTFHRVETEMTNDYGWPRNLYLKINAIFVVYMISAVVEHCFEVIHKINLIGTCKLDFFNSLELFLQVFVMRDVFLVIHYSLFLGILLELIFLKLVFWWNFVDVFIILLSLCIAVRFTQISSRVEYLVKMKVGDEKLWEKVRNDYTKLCRLCRFLDDQLSLVILLSFATNILFVLLQLFYSFKTRVHVMEKVYFSFSFLSAIARTFLVCLIGGKVNEEGMKPLMTLSDIPSSIYNKEIRRFIEYIQRTNISLTGRHYFIITKALVLNIAGAIISYEVVLIQFEGRALSNTPGCVEEFNCSYYHSG